MKVVDKVFSVIKLRPQKIGKLLSNRHGRKRTRKADERDQGRSSGATRKGKPNKSCDREVEVEVITKGLEGEVAVIESDAAIAGAEAAASSTKTVGAKSITSAKDRRRSTSLNRKAKG